MVVEVMVAILVVDNDSFSAAASGSFILLLLQTLSPRNLKST
jgi:hypothetical protein